jgi:hypothetical protein
MRRLILLSAAMALAALALWAGFNASRQGPPTATSIRRRLLQQLPQRALRCQSLQLFCTRLCAKGFLGSLSSLTVPAVLHVRHIRHHRPHDATRFCTSLAAHYQLSQGKGTAIALSSSTVWTAGIRDVQAHTHCRLQHDSVL